MSKVNVNAADGEVKNVVNMGRDEASKYYGSWCSPNANPATIVSWCDQRIQMYNEWIKNCQALKREMQKELIKGFDPAEIQALLAENDAQVAKA